MRVLRPYYSMIEFLNHGANIAKKLLYLCNPSIPGIASLPVLSPLGKPSFHIFLILFIFIFEIYEVMAFSLLGESARRAIEGTSKK